VVAIPWTIAADLARAVIGPDDPAAAVMIVVIGRRVVEPAVEVPVEAMMPVVGVTIAAIAQAGVTISAAAVDVRRAIPAAAIDVGGAIAAAELDDADTLPGAVETGDVGKPRLTFE